MPRGIATCQMSAIEKPRMRMGMVEPRCSKVAIGRASRVVTRMRTRQGMATRRLVRVIRVRTPASPRAARVAV